MTTIYEAIRAASEWAARLPKLPARGPAVDVAAPLRAAIAARDERARLFLINVIVTEKEHEDHTR